MKTTKRKKGCLEFCFLLYFSSYYLFCITEFLQNGISILFNFIEIQPSNFMIL